jgi:ABC-type transport system involved in multi-copper enzyme maturation permease subunit
MNTIITIAKLTFREAVRRKIVLAALILGIAFLLIYGLGFHFIQQEFHREAARQANSDFERSQAVNFLYIAGMYVVNFLSIAIAALISADSLAGEIQSGTIQAIVTKPILRSQVALGKWLGQAFLLLLYLTFLGGGVTLVVRLLSGFDVPGWLVGIGMIFFNGLIILSLTLALSSSLSTLATGGAVFGAYGLAFIGGWVERIGSILHNETAVNLGIFSSLLLPSEAIWNKASTQMTSPLLNLIGVTPFTSGSEPSTVMLVYAFLYMIAALAIAIRQFGRRDL